MKVALEETEYELPVAQKDEAFYAGSITSEQRRVAAVQSLSRMMQDMVNMAYYTTKYSTKDNPLVSDVLP